MFRTFDLKAAPKRYPQRFLLQGRYMKTLLAMFRILRINLLIKVIYITSTCQSGEVEALPSKVRVLGENSHVEAVQETPASALALLLEDDTHILPPDLFYSPKWTVLLSC